MHATINRTLWILAVTFMATTLFAGGPGQVRKVIDQEAGGGGSFGGDLSGSDLVDSSDDTVAVDDDLVVTGTLSVDPILLDDGAGNQTYLSVSSFDGSLFVGLTDGATNGYVYADRFNGNGNAVALEASSGVQLGSARSVEWSSTTAYSGAKALALEYVSPGIMKFYDPSNTGSTGINALQVYSPNESNYVAVSTGNSGTYFDYTGSGQVYYRRNGSPHMYFDSNLTVFAQDMRVQDNYDLRFGTGNDVYLYGDGSTATLTIDGDGAGAAAILAVQEINSAGGNLVITADASYQIRLGGNGIDSGLTGSGTIWTFNDPMQFGTGQGSVTHIAGPSDQSLLIQPGASQTLTLRSNDDNNSLSVNNTGVIVSSDVYLQESDRITWRGGGGAQLHDHYLTSMTDAAAATLLTVALPDSGDYASGRIVVVIHAEDGAGGYETAYREILWAAHNDDGTVTASSDLVNISTGVDQGSWTSVTTDTSVSTTNASIRITPNSSLTVTSMDADFHAVTLGGEAVTLP